jgi:hypothetical protein
MDHVFKIRTKYTRRARSCLWLAARLTHRRGRHPGAGCRWTVQVTIAVDGDKVDAKKFLVMEVK